MPASDHAVPLPRDPARVPVRKPRSRFSAGRARRWASLLGGIALAAAALRIRSCRRAAFATPAGG